MGWLSLTKKSNVKHAVIFDIASSSVGAALITHHHTKSTSPQVLYTCRTPINFSGGNGADHLANALAQATNTAADCIRIALSKLPKADKTFDVHVISHAPWSDSISKTENINFQHKTKLTKGLLRKITHKYFPEATQESSNIISSRITQVTLNDYPVAKVLGNTTEKVSVTALSSSMHMLIKNTLISTISQALHSKQMYFDAYTNAVSLLTERADMENKHQDAMLVDVGGEYIGITLIKNGATVAKTSIDFGSNHLLRAIVAGTDMSINTARSKLKMFNDNTCTPTECRNISNMLSSVEEQWVNSFGDTCAILSKKANIPSTVFLSSSTDSYNWFTKNIEKLDFAQFTFTTKPFTVKPVLDIEDVTKFYQHAQIRKDRRLLLESLFVDKCSPNGVYGKMFML